MNKKIIFMNSLKGFKSKNYPFFNNLLIRLSVERINNKIGHQTVHFVLRTFDKLCISFGKTEIVNKGTELCTSLLQN